MRKVLGFARMTSASQVPSVAVAAAVAPPGSSTATPYRVKSGRRRARSSRPPLACGVALIRASPSGAQAVSSGNGVPCSSNSSSGRYARIQASSWARCSGFSRVSESGTWCARQVPSMGTPSTSRGPVQPFGVHSTSAGQRGRSTGPPAASCPAACSRMRAISATISSSVAAIRSCTAMGSSPSNPPSTT